LNGEKENDIAMNKKIITKAAMDDGRCGGFYVQLVIPYRKMLSINLMEV